MSEATATCNGDGGDGERRRERRLGNLVALLFVPFEFREFRLNSPANSRLLTATTLLRRRRRWTMQWTGEGDKGRDGTKWEGRADYVLFVSGNKAVQRWPFFPPPSVPSGGPFSRLIAGVLGRENMKVVPCTTTRLRPPLFNEPWCRPFCSNDDDTRQLKCQN